MRRFATIAVESLIWLAHFIVSVPWTIFLLVGLVVDRRILARRRITHVRS
jgi:hypothetical protein